jgi:hypothetical protein
MDIPIAQGKAVVEPNRVLDDRHGEAVAIRLGVCHGGSAYPDPIKATQPAVWLFCELYLRAQYRSIEIEFPDAAFGRRPRLIIGASSFPERHPCG